MDEWDEVYERIHRLGKLADDWDGEGARGPTEVSREHAMALARSLSQKEVAPPTHVSITPAGSYLMVWRKWPAPYRDIEINRDGSTEMHP